MRHLLLLALLGCHHADPVDTADTDDTPDCAPGFSGQDCSFCTFNTAGTECHPGEPADLFDLEAIEALTPADMGWTVLGTTVQDGVEIVVGDVLTPFAAVDADGVDVDTTMRSRVALYLPEGWPEGTPAAARGKAMVVAAHFENKVAPNPIPETIARLTGMPVLYHGEYTSNWRDLGFPARSEINEASWRHVSDRNWCDPTDLTRGNYRRHMANVDLRMITLAQRLAEARGGALDAFALRGFSKEGHAAWLALATDDRIVVGSPGGSPFEDLLAYPDNLIEVYGCDGDPEQETTAHGAVSTIAWYADTPAGAAWMNQNDVGLNQGNLSQRILLMDGDTYQAGMHDGDHFVLGAEDTFLDELTAVPWRYWRKTSVNDGADGDDGDVVTTAVVPYLVAELLLRSDDPAGWYPKVTKAEASIDGEVLSVYAEVAGAPDTVALWASWSDDRIWNEVGQQPFAELILEPSGAGWAGEVDLAALGVADKVIGWYVEGRNTLTIGGKDHARKDATPIRFLQEPPPGNCDDVEPIDFCAL